MLNRVRALLGPLRASQVYATYPVQRLDVPITVESVTIDEIADSLGAVATGIAFMLHDYEGGRYNIREIGWAG